MSEVDKTYTVQEVADLLGLSEFTVRRRIKDGKLKAIMDSKKQGYRVTQDSLMEYAKAQNAKVGTLWQKGKEISGLAATIIDSTLMKSLPMIPAMVSIGALASIGIGKALGKIKGLNLDFFKDKDDVESDTAEINELNNVVVLDKIIERLNVELEDYDLQIEYQERKINQSVPDSEEHQAEQELLFKLKSQKFMIRKEIKDLEIRKAILEQMQTN